MRTNMLHILEPWLYSIFHFRYVSTRIMDHYAVLCAVRDQEVRKQARFLWEFYQCNSRPLEGLHLLGTDWSYDELMRVSIDS